MSDVIDMKERLRARHAKRAAEKPAITRQELVKQDTLLALSCGPLDLTTLLEFFRNESEDIGLENPYTLRELSRALGELSDQHLVRPGNGIWHLTSEAGRKVDTMFGMIPETKADTTALIGTSKVEVSVKITSGVGEVTKHFFEMDPYTFGLTQYQPHRTHYGGVGEPLEFEKCGPSSLVLHGSIIKAVRSS